MRRRNPHSQLTPIVQKLELINEFLWNYQQRYAQVTTKMQRLQSDPILNANAIKAIYRDLKALSEMADGLKCYAYSAENDAYQIEKGMRIKNPAYYIEDDYYDDEY